MLHIVQQFSLWNLPIIFDKYSLLLIRYFYDTLQAITEKRRISTKFNEKQSYQQQTKNHNYLIYCRISHNENCCILGNLGNNCYQPF